MRKKLLSKINLLLSALSLGLVGCHPAKSVVQPREPVERMYGPPVTIEPTPPKPQPTPLPEPPQPAPDPNEPTPVMYGVPWSEETR